MRGRVAGVYLGICVLWGSTWSINAVALRYVPPLLLVGARMALAALLLAPMALRERAGMPWAWVAGLGLLQVTIPYALMFIAQQWTPSGLSAVLFATFPVWVALLARFLLPGERLTARRLAGAALGVGGVGVLQAPSFLHLEASGRVALGGALITAASILAAAANVLVRRRPHAIRPFALTFGQTAVGAVLLLSASAVFERGRSVAWTPFALGAVAYLAVFGTVLTYAGLYWLARHVSVSAVGSIPIVDTTVAVTIGAVALREAIGWNLAVGAALVLSAVALEATAPPRPAAAAITSRRRP